jgi:urease accessory protein
MQRANGVGRIRFDVSDGRTRLSDLYQSGSMKIRLPKVYGQPVTAVLINTSGGLTGGDAFAFDVAAGDRSHAIVTSQTAERAYRSTGGSAKVTGRFSAGDGATLEWLPQETILFEKSNLSRSIEADLGTDSRLLMLESAVLGRKAMGETIRDIRFRDCWRIRRNGKLVFADDIRLEGHPDTFFKGPATGEGGRAFATLVDCATDAEDRLPLARRLLDDRPPSETRAAASAWNGVLAARFVSADSHDLRKTLMTFLTGYRSAELPRVWHC